MASSLIHLRQLAVAASLFPPTSLAQAIQHLGFVQADPIRAPARAQDLILRHRVNQYRIDDLDQQYTELDLEEDFLYAYGFMPQSTWQLFYPRTRLALSPLQQQVLAIVTQQGRIHPRQLEVYLGTSRERNDWGGYSKATTRALQTLHQQGYLRVAHRQSGIRLYERVALPPSPIELDERLRQLVLLLARLLGPLPERSLQAFVHQLRFASSTFTNRRSIVSKLIDAADLSSVVIDHVRYVWDASSRNPDFVNETVRFLTPFDPLVIDRNRFEHFWGWAYRFEAYTPPSKRQLGYYAMPILWRDDVVGWVNVSQQGDQIRVEPGFKKELRFEGAFEREYEAEVDRFAVFLQKR